MYVDCQFKEVQFIVSLEVVVVVIKQVVCKLPFHET